MADAYTGMGASTLDQAAYNLAVDFALRPELHFDGFATVKPTNQSMPGSSVIFNFASDLSAATTALNESVDVDAVAMSDTQVTVTLVEYGNALITTAKLRGTSYVPFDPIAANVIGFNAGDSLDKIARNMIQAGSNVRYATGGATDPAGRTSVEPEDKITAHDVRVIAADLKNANAKPINGYYVGVIHPDVALDLREETGAAAWRDPHTYSAPEAIFNGEIGQFEGFRWIETNRAPLFVDAGSSTTLTDVYGTLFFAQEAIAKAFSQTDGNGSMPMVIPGPVTDKLRRNVPLGWYWLGGYAVYRQACLRRVESSSSIGSNS